MSDCSNHKKDLFGETDMKVVAEMIGDLHYEALADLLADLGYKLTMDFKKDKEAGRIQLSASLLGASVDIAKAAIHISKAARISKPFMKP